jgi:hypothetical protein
MALRLPIGAELRNVEESQAGPLWPGLALQFELAGGTWLGDWSSDSRFRTYDGSHLAAESAEEVSREIARAILTYRAVAGTAVSSGSPRLGE